MDTEKTIHNDFAHGNLLYLDAIESLQKIGYSSREAERVVSEWSERNTSVEDQESRGD